MADICHVSLSSLIRTRASVEGCFGRFTECRASSADLGQIKSVVLD